MYLFYYNISQCKLGKLPIKYVDVWLHWKKKSNKEIWLGLISTFLKEVRFIKGKVFFSMGGRIIMLHSILSALPL
jgi:hypothetical protein